MQQARSEFSSKCIKSEEVDDEEDQQQSCSEPSAIRHFQNVTVKPNYIIRNAANTSGYSVKRIVVHPNGPDEQKQENNEMDRIASSAPIRPPNRPAHLAASKLVDVESPVKFWRTRSGKLVKMDAKVQPLGARAKFGGLINQQPRFIRLSNGKLARISTKKYPTSFQRGQHFNTCPSGPLGRRTSSARLEASETQRADSPSEPIDVTSLIGTASSSLSESEGTHAIKEEPMDVDEKNESSEHKQQENEEEQSMPRLEQPAEDRSSPSLSKEPSPKQSAPTTRSGKSQLSLASALRSGDLDNLVDQPLFRPKNLPTRNIPTFEKELKSSCSVCRDVVPGMKKNMLSLDARLSGLVEIVQNLIVYLNPVDRKLALLGNSRAIAAAANTTEEVHQSNQTNKASTTTSSSGGPPLRAIRRSDAAHEQEERIPSILLPVARRAENRLEMRTVGADAVCAAMAGRRSNSVRILRQSTASPDMSQRPKIGSTRFVVASRAGGSVMRVIRGSGAVVKSIPPSKAVSSEVREQVHVSAGDDVKPEVNG
ncbi:hypothetical protein Q1695_014158 [Nippostrongylus brasiliensis]|nr:hypothetical protein Q1695_014158 [Nippostrongylus brasiliensis]